MAGFGHRFSHVPSEGPVVTARVVAAVARSIDDTGVISVAPVAPVIFRAAQVISQCAVSPASNWSA